WAGARRRLDGPRELSLVGGAELLAGDRHAVDLGDDGRDTVEVRVGGRRGGVVLRGGLLGRGRLRLGRVVTAGAAGEGEEHGGGGGRQPGGGTHTGPLGW